MIVLRHLLCGLLVLGGAAAWAQDKDAEKTEKPAAKKSSVELNDARGKASYGIGRNIGNQLKNDELDVDVALLAKGISEALADFENPLSEDDFREAITEFQKSIQDKATAKNDEFLKKNSKEKGVKTTDSGLQYQVIKEGKGKKPSAKDTVEAHYKGTLLNGKVFDSSYDRGEPAQFPLSGVIKGWTEGVPLMTVGSKYKFWIPSDLAYGPRGRPPVIPPNSLLVFEIELLDVVAAEGKKAADGEEEDEELDLKVKKKVGK